MVAGTVYGFSVAGDLGSEVGTVRGVETQFGYLFGSLAGGLAIALGGFGALCRRLAASSSQRRSRTSASASRARSHRRLRKPESTIALLCDDESR